MSSRKRQPTSGSPGNCVTCGLPTRSLKLDCPRCRPLPTLGEKVAESVLKAAIRRGATADEAAKLYRETLAEFEKGAGK